MFSKVVALYRALGRPVLTADDTYVFNGAIAPATYALIEDYKNLDQRFGEIDVLELTETYADVEVTLPRGDVGKFHSDAKTFLEGTPSIAFGKIPDSFYIVNDDYVSGEGSKPEDIQSIESLSAFVKLLTEFAEDSNELSSGGQQRLIFILPPDGRIPQKTVVVPMKLEAGALQNQLNHFKILESLLSSSNDKKLHIEERRLVMKIAISDVLGQAAQDANLLTYLVKNWREVLRKYRYNFQAYINRFAFDEVRKKIADAEIEYASKLSGVLGDISGKLLALPVSIVAVIALEQAQSNFAFWSGCVGLFIVSIIFSLVLDNQKLQVTRLKSSFDLVFSPFFSKKNTYPTILRDVLAQREDGIEKQLKTLNLTFSIFNALALVPTAGAFYQIGAKYSEPLLKLFHYVFVR